MVCFNQMTLYKEPRKRRILYSWFSNQIVSNCFLFFSDNLLPKTESQSNNLKKNLPPSTLCNKQQGKPNKINLRMECHFKLNSLHLMLF